jgi:hypothetical protein
MRYTPVFLIASCALGLMAMLAPSPLPLAEAANASITAQQQPAAAAAQDANKLVYADFEHVQDKRPLSNHGGLVQLTSYEERPTLPSRYKGLADSNPPAPELVRLKQDDPNRAIAFDYELQGPNQYAGVGVEVHGQPDKDGKPVPDDVSEYKYLELQVYEKGVPSMRVEFISRGQGFLMSSGYPQAVFRVKEGFNTYRIPLKQVSQPSWAETKVSTKDILKKLTSITLVAYCDQCTPVKGTVVVDNIVFVK